MSSQERSLPPRLEGVTQHTNSFSDGQPIVTNANDENPGGHMPEEEHGVAAELLGDESINFPEQEEGRISSTQEAGQGGTDAKRKRKRLSQEEIRRLDKYAQCPHCSLVDARAGNLKVHWDYKKEHPEEYRVEDIWIFEREKGSSGPHKRRNNGGKPKAGPNLSGAPLTTQEMVRSDQVQPSDHVKSEASYLDQAGEENDPQDDIGQDRHPTFPRPRYFTEDSDPDFREEEREYTGAPTQNRSCTTRRENDRTMHDRRQTRSRISRQKVKMEHDDEDDDTSKHEVEAARRASLQSQIPPHDSLELNASTSTSYPTADPGQQFAPRADRPLGFTTVASLFNPTPPNADEPLNTFYPPITFETSKRLMHHSTDHRLQRPAIPPTPRPKVTPRLATAAVAAAEATVPVHLTSAERPRRCRRREMHALPQHPSHARLWPLLPPCKARSERAPTDPRRRSRMRGR